MAPLLLISMPAVAADGLGQQTAPISAPQPALASGSHPLPNAEVTIDRDGAAHFPALTVPFPSFASPQAKATLLEDQDYQQKLAKLWSEPNSLAEIRQLVTGFYGRYAEGTRKLYPSVSTEDTIAGVVTDVITPKDGVSPKNKNRVLINLHGGGFLTGSRLLGALESIPVASLGRFKVVAVDYRQGPEYKFPAASEDVAAVYRELLKSYKPQNIGIYGCSAGGMLTAEAIAWFEKQHLPLPGAIGIFCASAGGVTGSDSGYLAPYLEGTQPSAQSLAPPHPSVGNAAYFRDADFSDPLVAPICSPSVLASFPPTLMITSTRDIAMSSAVYTHTQLVKLGVDAELHVWDGQPHGFFLNPDLPESREVWDVVTQFFDKHLGAE